MCEGGYKVVGSGVAGSLERLGAMARKGEIQDEDLEELDNLLRATSDNVAARVDRCEGPAPNTTSVVEERKR
jgi:hypothetical protein